MSKLQIMNQTNQCLKENKKKVIGLMKDELGGKNDWIKKNCWVE